MNRAPTTRRVARVRSRPRPRTWSMKRPRGARVQRKNFDPGLTWVELHRLTLTVEKPQGRERILLPPGAVFHTSVAKIHCRPGPDDWNAHRVHGCSRGLVWSAGSRLHDHQILGANWGVGRGVDLGGASHDTEVRVRGGIESVLNLVIGKRRGRRKQRVHE